MKTELQFREILKKMKAYYYVLSVLGWDSSTEAPRESFSRRAEVMGVLSKELFAIQTGKETIDCVNELYQRIDELDDSLQREIKKAKKELDKIINIPEAEYVEYNKLIKMSPIIWENEKTNINYHYIKCNL